MTTKSTTQAVGAAWNDGERGSGGLPHRVGRRVAAVALGLAILAGSFFGGATPAAADGPAGPFPTQRPEQVHLRPDLAVSTWTWGWDQGGYYVRITVRNQGNAPAHSSLLRYKAYNGGYDFGLASIPALQPGASKVVTLRGQPCYTAGPEVVVDATDLVHESREDNNLTWMLHTC